MVVFEENLESGITVWNCCHPSGYAGRVEEVFHRNGLIVRRFKTNNQLHRLDTEGPAYEELSKDGKITYQSYWLDGKRHRPSQAGPAIIDSLCLTENYYFEYGVMLNNSENGAAGSTGAWSNTSHAD